MVSWLSAEDVAERYPGIVVPAYFSIPDVEHTRGPTVGRVAAAAGLVPDPQQQLALDIVFAVNDPQTQLALVATLCLVVGRQVMKSALFEMVLMGWLFVTGEEVVTYSAHEDKTAAAIWLRLSKRIKGCPALAELLPATENRGCYSANGQRRIELSDGRRIEFATRTDDAGRGMGNPKLIIDEAYACTQGMLDAILPTILAKPDPQVLFASMAGKASSEALRALRDEGRDHSDPDGAYIEYCSPPAAVICDDGDDCTHRWLRAEGCGFDKDEWRAVALPSYLKRLTKRAVDLLRKRLSPQGFGREVFGWWDEPATGDKQTSPINRDAWDEQDIQLLALNGDVVVPPPARAFAVEMDFDHTTAVISMAGREESGDGRGYVEFVAQGPGHRWAVARCRSLNDDHSSVVFVVDPGGPAAPLIEDLVDAGCDVVEPTTADVIEAYSDVVNAVLDRDLLHAPQEEMDDAIEAARRRRIGDRGFTFDRKAVESLPIIAAGLARWGMDKGTDPSVFFLGELDEDDDETAGDGPEDDEWV